MSVHTCACTVLLLVLAQMSLAQQARSGPPGVFQNPARSKQLQLRPCTSCCQTCPHLSVRLQKRW